MKEIYDYDLSFGGTRSRVAMGSMKRGDWRDCFSVGSK